VSLEAAKVDRTGHRFGVAGTGKAPEVRGPKEVKRVAGHRKRFGHAAALSAVAVASLVGAPSANGQIICEVCPEQPPPGILEAFSKWVDLKFPGETEDALLKIAFGLSNGPIFGK
jgi:hypothetical protein